MTIITKGYTIAKIVEIPPGRLGVTVEFAQSRGAIIKAIRPTCPFKDEIQLGDHIATIDGKKFSKPEDLIDGNDKVRQLGIIPKSSVLHLSENRSNQQSHAAISFIHGENHSNKAEKATAGKRKRDEVGGISTESATQVGQAEANTDEGNQRQQETEKQAQHIQPHADDWEHRCQQILRYKCEHGNCNNIPPNYKAPDDHYLGEWVEKQRKLYNLGKLDPKRAYFLQNQGFVFQYDPPSYGPSSGDELWDRKLKELIEYKELCGNCDVAIDYPQITLGLWVQTQRDMYKKGTLDKNRHLILEQKGFLFEPGTNVKRTVIDSCWRNNYEELRQFKRDHGHLEVPTDYKSTSMSAYLDRWLARQRTLYRRKELSCHQTRMLQELGLDLCGKKKNDGAKMEKIWESMFNEMLEYREEHGDCRVPTNQGKLGRWVRVQRKFYNKGKLSEKRIERLVDVGFDFDPLNRLAGDATVPAEKDSENNAEDNSSDYNIFNSAAWVENYEAMKVFIESNGTADVPPLYKMDGIEGSLHIWIETQKRFFREGNLPQQQVEMLEEIGVDLNEASKYSSNRNDAGWNNMFTILEKFQEKHGHTDVSELMWKDFQMADLMGIDFDSFGWAQNLPRWIQRQREYYKNKTLPEDRQLKLESLGMDLRIKGERKEKSPGVKVGKKQPAEDEDVKPENPSAEPKRAFARQESKGDITEEGLHTVAASTEEADAAATVSFAATAIQLQAAATPTDDKPSRAGRRCRNCGLIIIENRDTHKAPLPPIIDGERPQNRTLRNIPGYRYEDHCKVPPSAFAPGFPLQPGESFPRRPRSRKRKIKDSDEALPTEDNDDAATASVGGTDDDLQNLTPTKSSTDDDKPSRAGRRCRKCGLIIKENRDRHKTPLPPMIDGERPQNRNLRNIPGYRYEDHCKVPRNEYVPGFPLQPGDGFPRHPRSGRKDIGYC